VPKNDLTLVCDFDGTITTADIGQALCDRFAPGVLERVDARRIAGEISLGVAFREICRGLRASREEMVRHALDVATMREGFADLVGHCRDNGIEVVVASAGLDLYVEPILERDLGSLRQSVEVRANAARVTADGVEVDFPHEHPDCETCANCKGLRARSARRAGRTVIGIGDSFTDACLLDHSDHVFARAWLADHCQERKMAHETYDDFAPVLRLVRRLSD
jgi:2-hydroxy-3-keto-5-methylthiopentenyl-1-phosphate phosphatase